MEIICTKQLASNFFYIWKYYLSLVSHLNFNSLSHKERSSTWAKHLSVATVRFKSLLIFSQFDLTLILYCGSITVSLHNIREKNPHFMHLWPNQESFLSLHNFVARIIVINIIVPLLSITSFVIVYKSSLSGTMWGKLTYRNFRNFSSVIIRIIEVEKDFRRSPSTTSCSGQD